MSRPWYEQLKVMAYIALVTPGLGSLAYTWQFKYTIHPDTQALLDSGQPVIFAIWHAQIYSVMKLFKGMKRDRTAILISNSNDGEMIAQSLKNMGFKYIIRGGAKRGGAQAVRDMIRAIKNHQRNIFFAADGPFGPPHIAKNGIIRLASQTGAPIVALTPSCKRFIWIAKSWDGFQIPQFFAPVNVEIEAPLWVPKGLKSDTDTEPYRADLEQRLKIAYAKAN